MSRVREGVAAFVAAVRDGRTGGPSVRLAVDRWEADCLRTDVWLDWSRVERFERWCRAFVRYEHADGVTRPWSWAPWQCFMFSNLLGWQAGAVGRFWRAYVESAKGPAKTPSLSMLALYRTFYDGETDAQSYILAATADQARVPMRFVEQAIDRAPDRFTAPLRVYGGSDPSMVRSLAGPTKGSFLLRLASRADGEGLSGPRMLFGLADEFHEWTAGEAALEKLSSSAKGRTHPMLAIATNSGHSMATPCGAKHLEARRMLRGETVDDKLFAMIGDVDEALEWDDRAAWVQAGWNQPESPGWAYVDNEIEKGRASPSAQSTVARLGLARWGQGVSAFVHPTAWRESEVDELPEEAWGWPCAIGLDLSSYHDLTAGAIAFRSPHDGCVWALVQAWTPLDTLIDRQRETSLPLAQWVEGGSVEAIPGPTIDLAPVAERVAAWLGAAPRCKGVAQDWHRIRDLEIALAAARVRAVRITKERPRAGPGLVGLYGHPMGFSGLTQEVNMTRSIESIDRLIAARRLRVVRSPALRSSVLGLGVIPDGKGNRSTSRLKSNGFADPAHALIEAVGLLDATPAPPPALAAALASIGAPGAGVAPPAPGGATIAVPDAAMMDSV